MADSTLTEREGRFGEQKQIDCVEVYLPKSIEFLSELYRFLREKVTNPFDKVSLDGLSIYKVDGVFRGEKLWEQRTLIIRLLFVRPIRGPQLIGWRAELPIWEGRSP
jgi:hypothetical protein